MRTLPFHRYMAIKAATKRLIELCGGVEGAATITRVAKSSLANYQDRKQIDCFMPADVMADLEHFAGEAVLSGVLAGAVGEAPHVPGDPIDRCMGAADLVGRVCGEVRAARGLKSEGGPVITPAEASRARGAVEDARAELDALDRDLADIETAAVTRMPRQA